ncbi:DUF6234 family protein [Streptomyces pinistramenti]|uniref:DUF6234 family protein n=1 Tax=Streptomyces pinistramenti TaxID=2884812 RepID=UPI001D0889F0|nr:DUF6234 family protein [Streptomyces pinistramenti]MCB5911475.1 DUF6234 family protein [Streptomyces pinistramenti]
MTPPSAPERRRPWSRRTRWGVDLALAIPLFLLKTAWLGLDWMFGLGLETGAAQGDTDRIDAAGLAHIGRMQVLLIAVLIVASLAEIFRARWMVIAHLLVTLLSGGVLVAVQHQWGSSHAPSPRCIRYSAHC